MNNTNNDNDMVSVTIKIPKKTYRVFEKASTIVGQVGLQIPVKQIIETMASSEFSSLEPNKAAKRFTQALINSLKGATVNEVEEEDEDILLEDNAKLEIAQPAQTLQS